MIRWIKQEYAGYVSECGRFKVYPTVSARHRQDGFNWTVNDSQSKMVSLTKTLAAGKKEAESFSRRWPSPVSCEAK